MNLILATASPRRTERLNLFGVPFTVRVAEIDETMLPAVKAMAEAWYENRAAQDPDNDFYMEQVALHRAFEHWDALGLDGMVLVEDGRVIAMTIGSVLGEKTYDVHFEKALERNDGTYAAINQGFAAWLREKYPALQYLNREDDMGIEGLRKAKLSYCPDHMVEKSWGLLRDDS